MATSLGEAKYSNQLYSDRVDAYNITAKSNLIGYIFIPYPMKKKTPFFLS